MEIKIQKFLLQELCWCTEFSNNYYYLLSSAQNGEGGKGLNIEILGLCCEVQMRCITKIPKIQCGQLFWKNSFDIPLFVYKVQVHSFSTGHDLKTAKLV